MEFSHPRVGEILSAAHRIREVNLPTISFVNISECGGDSAFRHHGMRFAEQRFANQADREIASGGFNRGAESGTSRADY